MADEHLIHRIQEALQELRPAIQMDGGDIQFVAFNDGVVQLKMHGACRSCPMSLYTLKLGIEEHLIERISEVREVVAIE